MNIAAAPQLGNVHVFPPPPAAGRANVRVGAVFNPQSNMTCHGGPVQTATKVYIVLWGAQWSTTGDPDGEAAQMQKAVQALPGSRYDAIVHQYYSFANKALSGGVTAYGGTWNDTSLLPATPQQQDLANAAIRGVDHFGDRSPNAVYIVATPHGVAPSGYPNTYCAWHSTTSDGANNPIAYVNMPYNTDANCGQFFVGGKLDGVTIALFHEIYEVNTDPFINGWYYQQLMENGDLCAWGPDIAHNPNAGGFVTQSLWDNATTSCVQFK